MTQDERNKVGLLIGQMAIYYGRQIMPEVVSMYLDDLEEFAAQQVVTALTKYRRESKRAFMPTVAEIREMIRPGIDEDAIAREAAARISQAIVSYGWNNGGEAQQFIGELGWRVVERYGGWRYLCENHGLSIDPGQFMAQARDLAKAQLHFEESGADFTAIGPALSKDKREQLALESRQQANGIITNIVKESGQAPTKAEAEKILDAISKAKVAREVRKSGLGKEAYENVMGGLHEPSELKPIGDVIARLVPKKEEK